MERIIGTGITRIVGNRTIEISEEQPAKTHTGAIKNINKINKETGENWRLPAREELSLFIGMEGATDYSLWTSTPNYGTNDYWVLDGLSTGYWYGYGGYCTGANHYRCVREVSVNNLNETMKIIVMRGLPASGKSTKAKEIMESGGNYIRLNRDLLREMFHFNKWTPRNEEITIDIMNIIAKNILSRKRANLIIDDTNLSEGHLERWKMIAKEFNAKVEVIKMDVLLEECIERDKKREKPIGFDVITNMARQHSSQGYYDFIKKDIIADIDGTIADTSERQHYMEEAPKNWKRFFSEISNDKPREEVIALLSMYAQDHNICFVSGRPDNYKKETMEWLDKNIPFSYHTLIMRKAGDRRKDSIIKKEILNKYFKKDSVDFVIDDRPQVIVECWTTELGKDKVIDVGDNALFKREREELEYYTS